MDRSHDSRILYTSKDGERAADFSKERPISCTLCARIFALGEVFQIFVDPEMVSRRLHSVRLTRCRLIKGIVRFVEGLGVR